MILCKNCTFLENCYYCQVVGTRTECKTYKPMTNEEWLQTCDTEQLAEVLYRFYRDGRHDELQRQISINEKSFVDLLKQLHREE